MKAGWIAALVYLLCVMAPTLSYALPGDHAAGPCPTPLSTTSLSMHADSAKLVPAVAEMVSHDHSMHAAKLASEMRDMSAHDMSAMVDDMASKDVPAKKGPHTSSGQCCALMCVGGMPAALHDVAFPALPAAAEIFGVYRLSAGVAPSVNYRPPIA